MFSKDISRYIDVMIKSIEKHPNINLDSVYIQSPDDASVPSKNEISESFVYLAIYPKTQVNDFDSLNSYVDEILFEDFRPDSIKSAQEEKKSHHIPSLVTNEKSDVRLPLLSLSKEYLLSKNNNAVLRELHGNNIHLSGGSDSDTLIHKVNYDIIIFPDSDIASQFVPESHRFGKPYIASMSIFRSSD
ncbi:MAG: hypothetical protein KAJ20_01220 [Candidatus Aenigmarchaeota archaeon]|nr:hypothetical protein [Candidatus Aenigmarchaeota archaeon]